MRRIFSRYAAGKSPSGIALALNAERVPVRAACAWSGSTISGNRARGTGILNNELYIGRLVWNRMPISRTLRPDGGVSRTNSREQWIIESSRPAHRRAGLGNAVQARLRDVRRACSGARICRSGRVLVKNGRRASHAHRLMWFAASAAAGFRRSAQRLHCAARLPAKKAPAQQAQHPPPGAGTIGPYASDRLMARIWSQNSSRHLRRNGTGRPGEHRPGMINREPNSLL